MFARTYVYSFFWMLGSEWGHVQLDLGILPISTGPESISGAQFDSFTQLLVATAHTWHERAAGKGNLKLLQSPNLTKNKTRENSALNNQRLGFVKRRISYVQVSSFLTTWSFSRNTENTNKASFPCILFHIRVNIFRISDLLMQRLIVLNKHFVRTCMFCVRT